MLTLLFFLLKIVKLDDCFIVGVHFLKLQILNNITLNAIKFNNVRISELSIYKRTILFHFDWH